MIKIKLISLAVATLILSACGQIDKIKDALADSDTNSANHVPCSTCRIFVTSIPASGDFGGITGADARCALDPNKPNNSTYRALIVGSSRRACSTSNCVMGGLTEHVDWVMKPNTAYMRPDGFALGVTDVYGLLPFPLPNALDGTVANIDTGLNSNYTNNVNTCANWMSASSSASRAEGRSDLISSGAIAGSTSACNYANNIYCVEQ